MKKNEIGYKKKIHRANILMIIVVIGSIIVFNISNLLSVNQYTSSVRRLTNLN